MEALHKPLKDAYDYLNLVYAVEQSLYPIYRDYAIQMKELNLVICDAEIKLPADVC